MKHRDIFIMASVRSLMRGEVTAGGLAERFGVTEAQVLRWKDVFEIAGTLALANIIGAQQSVKPRRIGRRKPNRAQASEPTTHAFWGEPTTHAFWGEPTTTPDTKDFSEPTTNESMTE